MPTRKGRPKQSTCVTVDGSTDQHKKATELFLQDFDAQGTLVVTTVAASRRLEAMCKALNDGPKLMELTLHNFLLQIPQNVCQMPWETFLEYGGTIKAAQDALDAPYSNAGVLQSAKKKKTKASRLQKIDNALSCESLSESDETSLTKANAKTKTKKKGAVKRLAMPPPSTRSSRYRTPAQQQKLLSTTNDTPLVTPAFDSRLPKTPSVRCMSLNGSPHGFKVIPLTDKRGKKQKVHLADIEFDIDNMTIPDMALDADVTEQLRRMQFLINSILGDTGGQ